MIKSQEDVLHSLEALHLSAMVYPSSVEFRRGHVLALLCVAQQWNVSGEFLQFVRQHGQQSTSCRVEGEFEREQQWAKSL
jgi:hypothetical protein